ncbi:MAG: hypothetical protein H7333_10610 [Bdellovibrionales bacterium]|nr:hypothetical protein [Oligoflexia bacterium]
MKTIIILSAILFSSLNALAIPVPHQGGLVFVCASEDNDFKITADLSDGKGDRIAAVVDEGAKYVYPEFQGKTRKHFFTVNWSRKAKTLIQIKKPGQKSAIITLTTDPENNHAVVTMDKDGFKQTKLDAVLSTPSQEIKEQPVSCLVAKWNE